MRMIGGSTRLSTLVIDANKSWEEKTIEDVILKPSIITPTDFQSARVDNLVASYNNISILESTTVTSIVGTVLTKLKSLTIGASGYYVVSAEAYVLAADRPGAIYIKKGEEILKYSDIIEEIEPFRFETSVIFLSADSVIDFWAKGFDPISQTFIEICHLWGADYFKAPAIILE